MLEKLGLDYELLDSGCCGMAGAFGFEKGDNGDHYDVSIKCGERVLLPAVRDADDFTLIVSDGFSCREQIAQTTDRQALHIAQVLKMALDGAQPMARTELRYMPDIPTESRRATTRGLIAAGVLGTLAATVALAIRHGRRR